MRRLLFAAWLALASGIGGGVSAADDDTQACATASPA
jgi:hypothetical protein